MCPALCLQPAPWRPGVAWQVDSEALGSKRGATLDDVLLSDTFDTCLTLARKGGAVGSLEPLFYVRTSESEKHRLPLLAAVHRSRVNSPPCAVCVSHQRRITTRQRRWDDSLQAHPS